MTTTDLPLRPTLPKASYTDEAQFDRERDAVLLPSWFCVGRADVLAAAGDYLTADVAGESIIIVRGESGAAPLRGFYNQCRRRGERLVPPQGAGSGTGTARSGRFTGTIRCPHHAWTYGLNGELRSAPFLPDVRDDRSALALHPVEVGTWGGFVFARCEPGRQGLSDALGGVPARLASYPLAELRTGARLTYRVAANWKVILENYHESYHCGPVHPELCELVPDFAYGGADLDAEAGIPHRLGAYAFTAPGRTIGSPLRGLSEPERTRHKGELVLPNLMISLSGDHVAAFTVWPRAAGNTTVVCDFLFDPYEIARPDFDPADAVNFRDLVNAQDWLICERVQDGMTSRRFTTGYLAPVEQPSADVGRYVTERLGGPRAR
jgi:glycine betaine catabolism A